MADYSAFSLAVRIDTARGLVRDGETAPVAGQLELTGARSVRQEKLRLQLVLEAVSTPLCIRPCQLA